MDPWAWTAYVDDYPFVPMIMSDDEGNYYYPTYSKWGGRILVIVVLIGLVLILGCIVIIVN